MLKFLEIGFGRQVDSFESDISFSGIEEKLIVFIRAPIVNKVSKNVEVLSKLKDGTIVGIKENKILGIFSSRNFWINKGSRIFRQFNKRITCGYHKFITINKKLWIKKNLKY